MFKNKNFVNFLAYIANNSSLHLHFSTLHYTLACGVGKRQFQEGNNIFPSYSLLRYPAHLDITLTLLSFFHSS